MEPLGREDADHDDHGKKKFSESMAKEIKHKYSRAELEALRFLDVEWQRRRWKEVFQCLASVVADEYFDHQHQHKQKSHDDHGEKNFSKSMAKEIKHKYSRAELEALRFLDVEWQRRRWKEVFQCLASVVADEYFDLQHQHKQKSQKKSKKGKEPLITTSGMFIESFANSTDDLDVIDIVCGDNLASNSSCMAVEELGSEDDEDDSDREYESIMRPAFLVEGEPDFESGPPQDGMEYLRRVRWEAAKIPKFKVARLNLNELSGEQTPYMPSIPEIAKCPSNLLPSKYWEDAFLAEFSKIKQAFSELESYCSQPTEHLYEQSDKQHWLNVDPTVTRLPGMDIASRAATLVNFAGVPETAESEAHGNQLTKGHCKQGSKQRPEGAPTVSSLLEMDAVSRAATLVNFIDILQTPSTLSKNDCEWLFALCVAVDFPLHAETTAALRCLLRKCMTLLTEKSELDDDVAMLSIIITIAGKYFGQSET